MDKRRGAYRVIIPIVSGIVVMNAIEKEDYDNDHDSDHELRKDKIYGIS